MKPKMPTQIRLQVAQYIKNQLDISELISGYSIAGEDLTNSIIKNLVRPDDDISGCIFANASIGSKENIVNLNRVIARGCNFRHTQFNGEVWARKADLRGSSFTCAFLPYVDYRAADLRGCDFCGAIFQIATPKSLGAKFDAQFFKDLAKHWNLEIIIKNDYN